MSNPVRCLGDTSCALRLGQSSISAYVADLIARKRQWDHLNCIVAFDEDQVMDAARSRDEERKSGRMRGALHGIPFVAKDNIDTTDLPTTACTPALLGHYPPRNAAVIDRLLGVGAILFAKANMHELAFGVTNNHGAFGAARNPYSPELIPGGSSGGTAAAVAAGIVPFGLGSDTGGSVRIPAALCGIVGLRPTQGRYPAEGVVPISVTRDTVGPVARNVATVALIDGILSGGDSASEAVSLAELRLGVPRRYFFEDLEPAVAAAMENFLQAAKSQGATLIEEDIPDVESLNEAVSLVVVNFEARSALEQYLKCNAPAVSFDEVVAKIVSADVQRAYVNFAKGDLVSEEAYWRAINVDRRALQKVIHEYFQIHKLDAYIIPTCGMTARPIGQDDTVELNGRQVPTFRTFIKNAEPSSNAGIPSISIPITLTRTGLPVGAMIEAQSGFDRRLLAMATSLERLCSPLQAPTCKPVST